MFNKKGLLLLITGLALLVGCSQVRTVGAYLEEVGQVLSSIPDAPALQN